MADALNGYFENFTREDITNMLESIFCAQKRLADIEFEDNVVLDKLNKLKTNEAAGPDGI